ncbi:unnamed protein product [Caenorhabditis brenneri]
MSVSNVSFPCTFDGCTYQAVPTSMRKHMKQVHKASESEIHDFNARVQATKAHARGSELFACNQCPQKFTSKGAVQNHLRLKHPVQQIDQPPIPSSVPPPSIASSPNSSPPKSPREPEAKSTVAATLLVSRTYGLVVYCACRNPSWSDSRVRFQVMSKCFLLFKIRLRLEIYCKI